MLHFHKHKHSHHQQRQKQKGKKQQKQRHNEQPRQLSDGLNDRGHCLQPDKLVPASVSLDMGIMRT